MPELRFLGAETTITAEPKTTAAPITATNRSCARSARKTTEMIFANRTGRDWPSTRVADVGQPLASSWERLGR